MFTRPATTLLKTVAATCAFAAMMLTAPQVFAQEADAQFDINTTFEVRFGDYLLPPGDYRVERIADPGIFVMYDDSDLAKADPVAMIDAWQLPAVNHEPGTGEPAETGARLQIAMDPEGHSIPELRGWVVLGREWKVRDVVEPDDGGVDVLTALFD